LTESGLAVEAHSLVILVLLDLLAAHRFSVKDQPILFDDGRANRLEHLDEVLDGMASFPQQVEVACRAMRLVGPNPEEHRALEDEFVPVLRAARAAEPIEEASMT
jgi:hypothetical protein